MILPNLIYNPQNMEFSLITFSKCFKDFMKPFNRYRIVSGGVGIRSKEHEIWGRWFRLPKMRILGLSAAILEQLIYRKYNQSEPKKKSTALKAAWISVVNFLPASGLHFSYSHRKQEALSCLVYLATQLKQNLLAFLSLRPSRYVFP